MDHLYAEPRVFVVLRRLTIVAACAYGVLFSWGIYRRLWQVQRIELQAPATTLRPGTHVGYDVVTSGEVHNLIRLELVQGDRRAVLDERWSDVSRVNTLDPRLFRYQPVIAVTPGILAAFAPGVAALRLTVFGNRKLLRTPAPRVREVPVRIAAGAASRTPASAPR